MEQAIGSFVVVSWKRLISEQRETQDPGDKIRHTNSCISRLFVSCSKLEHVSPAHSVMAQVSQMIELKNNLIETRHREDKIRDIEGAIPQCQSRISQRYLAVISLQLSLCYLPKCAAPPICKLSFAPTAPLYLSVLLVSFRLSVCLFGRFEEILCHL